MKQYVRKQCHARLTALDKAIRTLRKSPQAPEALHGVRVSTRRLQQCLRLFPAFLPKKSARKLKRRLRRLMEHCGLVRNWDIAQVTLKTAKLLSPELRARCKAERSRHHAFLISHLERWRGPRSPRHWKKILDVSSADWNPAMLAKAIREWFEAGDRAQDGDAADLHRFRLLGKRLRYSLELLEPILQPSVAPALRTLKSVQDRLGDISDCATTQRLIPEAAEQLQTELHRRTAKYRATWNAIRNRRTKWNFTFCGTAKPNRASPVGTTKTAR